MSCLVRPETGAKSVKLCGSSLCPITTGARALIRAIATIKLRSRFMQTSVTNPSPGETAKTAQRIGVPREVFPGEKRVATVPEVVEKLIKLGFAVSVESGAGDASNFSDEAYRAAGATVVADAAQLWASSDIVFKVGVPT